VFQGESPTGLRVEKRYRFDGDGYVFHVVVHVSGEGASRSIGLILTPMPLDGTGAAGRGTAVALVNQRLTEKTLVDVREQPIPLEPAVWGGFAPQYFLSAALPLGGPPPRGLAARGGRPPGRLDTPLGP